MEFIFIWDKHILLLSVWLKTPIFSSRPANGGAQEILYHNIYDNQLTHLKRCGYHVFFTKLGIFGQTLLNLFFLPFYGSKNKSPLGDNLPVPLLFLQQENFCLIQ